ncbi:hypothetical protein Bpfe_008577 [Biomphalaria pfeifferi]|uniref:Serine protease n=1 Tax=Biomphalaria pfeifferi TaxID=112525 RepID=A0AAD8BWC6_BIOPF|nr:hypothetical protein Bpfe_008577 [Biomphalaria pfeifferi]
MSDIEGAGTTTTQARTELNLLQGNHECEVSFNGEAGLHLYRNRCTKNPNHSKFIPLPSFTASYLPLQYGDEDIVQTIKLNASLTVRICCTQTSLDRPQFFADDLQPFPFYNYQGRPLTRTGTGRAWSTRVFKHSDNTPCPCSKCVGVGNKTWGRVSVYTARHVVFDKHEARNTSCRFGYDSEEHLRDGLTVDLEGVDIGVADHHGDVCEIICVTHDLGLVEKITQARISLMKLNAKIYNKYRMAGDEHRLVIIVSHPHGCSKQVTVGEWTAKNSAREAETAYTYTTDTCPGSSGAAVYILGRLGVGFCHLHSGSTNQGNVSGYWMN